MEDDVVLGGGRDEATGMLMSAWVEDDVSLGGGRDEATGMLMSA
ncbi:Hypothetical protein CAP_4636 [Chondromyces apiculatus DSM 436]|uniref:Uncharacterized protein n=1 Tax=Chondromyces apiculatus DSM 436 TaxID=1192034 RepID=A0A017T5J8_9BACT|nr:Hypothetical protein CAP_4636 [Chondromyces apiculatus DSM 436]